MKDTKQNHISTLNSLENEKNDKTKKKENLLLLLIINMIINEIIYI